MVWGFWSPSRWYSKFHLGWNASTFTTIAIRSFLSYLGLGIDFLSFIGSGDAYTTLLLSFGSRLILHFTLWIFFWLLLKKYYRRRNKRNHIVFWDRDLFRQLQWTCFNFFKWLFANELQVTSGDCQIPDASTVHLLVWIPVLWRKWWPSRMFVWYDVSWQGRLVHNCSEMQIEIIAGSHQGSRLLSAFVILDAVDISSGEPHAVKRDASNLTDRGLQDVFCRDSPKVSEISSFLYLQLGLLGNSKNGWHGHGVLVDSPCWEMKKSKVPDIRKRWDFFDDLSSKLQKKIRSSSERTKSWQFFFQFCLERWVEI